MLRSQHDWIPIVVRASSCLAALVNTACIILGHSSTLRGTYHLGSFLIWIWLSALPSYSTIWADALFPWTLAAAFLLDIFYSRVSPTELPPDIHSVNKIEPATYAWLDPIINFSGILDFVHLPSICLPTDFQKYQFRFNIASGENSSIFWGFISLEHKSALIESSLLRLVDDASRFGLPWLLRELLVSPTANNAAIMFSSRVIGALCGN